MTHLMSHSRPLQSQTEFLLSAPLSQGPEGSETHVGTPQSWPLRTSKNTDSGSPGAKRVWWKDQQPGFPGTFWFQEIKFPFSCSDVLTLTELDGTRSLWPSRLSLVAPGLNRMRLLSLPHDLEWPWPCLALLQAKRIY